MICDLKVEPFSVQQFIKNFNLGFENSMCYDHMRSQPQFHATIEKSLFHVDVKLSKDLYRKSKTQIFNRF